MGSNKYFLIILGMASCISCLPKGGEREKRFSIFQIIKFENGDCAGTTRNGTCFTDQECESRGGTKDGNCADGFGVCCIKMLTDGETSSLNMTHISSTRQARQVTVSAGSQKYTICPASDDICRIRFDFTTFVLATPVTDPGTLDAADVLSLAIQGPSIGDCTEDQFSITTPASGGTPIICGTNTGQHMIVDSDGVGCSDVNFLIGSSNFARSWDITVLQFECADEMGGPSGCLQWFTDATGSIRSFNFPLLAAGAAVALDVVHLSNQHYKSCVRRAAGTSQLCFVPCTHVDPVFPAQSSFGLSVAVDANANSGVDSDCSSDWIEIRGGADPGADPSTVTRFCGRELSTLGGANAVGFIAAHPTVCTSVVPFEIRVEFDHDEVQDDAATCDVAESACAPGGIVGFSLCYTSV